MSAPVQPESTNDLRFEMSLIVIIGTPTTLTATALVSTSDWVAYHAVACVLGVLGLAYTILNIGDRNAPARMSAAVVFVVIAAMFCAGSTLDVRAIRENRAQAQAHASAVQRRQTAERQAPSPCVLPPPPSGGSPPPSLGSNDPSNKHVALAEYGSSERWTDPACPPLDGPHVFSARTPSAPRPSQRRTATTSPRTDTVRSSAPARA